MSAKQINLLPSEEFEMSTVGRILKWALTSFRVMVVGVEIVVIAAFLSRFILDAKNNDLNDEIKTLQGTIMGNATFEKEFRQTQARLSIYKALSSDESASSLITKISSRLPLDVVLQNILVKNGKVTLTGTTANEASISQLIANLSAEQSFNKVGLSSVTSDEETVGAFTFTVTFETKKEGGES